MPPSSRQKAGPVAAPVRCLPPRTTATAALCLATAALLGCGQVRSSGAQYAQLRVIDASNAATGLDVAVGSTTLAYNIGFGNTVHYTPVIPGTYTLSVNAAGSKTVVSSVRGTLAAGTQSTLLVSAAGGATTTQLLQDSAQPAPGNQCTLRVLDQANLAGAVDLYFVPSGTTLPNTRAVATAVTAGSTASFNLPAGTYQLVLLPAGTVPTAATGTTAATVPLYTSAATSLPAGSVRTTVLLDNQVTTTPAMQLLVLSDYDSPSATP